MKRIFGYRKWFRAMISALAIGLFTIFIGGPVHADETSIESIQSEAATAIEPRADAASMLALGYAAPLDFAAAAAAPGEDFDEDPWEGFNEKMFSFNREILDRFLLRPIGTAWDFILPDSMQRGIRNMFDNIDVVRRVVNNSLQLKLTGAGTELVRFTINSTVGVAGFFDVAKDAFGIEQRDEDTGQTFGVWGMGQGPYLVMPFLPPATVRDGIGYLLDGAMFPPSYFIPWWGTIAGAFTETVNERSLNLDRFERVAASTVDLYGAVRNAYLQRRAAAVKQ